MRQEVLINMERLRYPHSGIATVLTHLANGLIANNTTQHITLFGAQASLQPFGLPIKQWHPMHKYLPWVGKSYKVIHVCDQLSPYFHHKHSTQKKIVTLHDLNFLHENNSTSRIQKYIKKVRNNLQNADVIVCISQFAKNDLLAHLSLFHVAPQTSIQVIYNGLQLPDVRQSYSLGRYGYLKDKKFLLNIGVLFPKKNQLSLLQMLPYITEDVVLVASDKKGGYETIVKQFIQQHQLADRVHFLHHITQEEKFALMQHCQSYVHPSLAEGFGIPPVEAMAFGKPIFLSNLTSLPEVGGEVSYYFPDFEPKRMAKVYREGMENFYQNRDDKAQQLQQRAKQFDYKAMAREYYLLYERLLKD